MDGSGSLGRRLREYLAHLSVERGLSQHTLNAYQRDLSRYVQFLLSEGVTDLNEVTRNLVSRYPEVLRNGSDGGNPLSASSAARAVVAVRGWHKFELLEGNTEQDPAAAIKPPGSHKRLPKAITIDEVQQLIEGAEAAPHPLGLRDRALVEVLYGTGARISEAVNLALDDIDLDAGALRLFGKGRKERIVPIGQYAITALEAYVVRCRPVLAPAGTGSSVLFLNQRGNPLSRQSAWAVLQDASHRAGLNVKISPHTLRHSYATHLLAGGADVRVVQELLGHASVATTQVYTLVTPDTLREIYLTSHPRAR